MEADRFETDLLPTVTDNTLQPKSAANDSRNELAGAGDREAAGEALRQRIKTGGIEGTGVQILDTRKTIPGLRLAQKYAVRCGGAMNHRIGLFDAILIKENHIKVTGSISAAIAQARKLYPQLFRD